VKQYFRLLMQNWRKKRKINLIRIARLLEAFERSIGQSLCLHSRQYSTIETRWKKRFRLFPMYPRDSRTLLEPALGSSCLEGRLGAPWCQRLWRCLRVWLVR
jgi:hypothetical protein